MSSDTAVWHRCCALRQCYFEDGSWQLLLHNAGRCWRCSMIVVVRWLTTIVAPLLYNNPWQLLLHNDVEDSWCLGVSAKWTWARERGGYFNLEPTNPSKSIHSISWWWRWGWWCWWWWWWRRWRWILQLGTNQSIQVNTLDLVMMMIQQKENEEKHSSSQLVSRHF